MASFRVLHRPPQLADKERPSFPPEVLVRFRSAAVLVALTASALPLLPAAPAAAAPAQAWSHTYGGWNRSSSPTIADVNGDGVNDIVHGHQDGWVRVLDAATGNNLPGWPQPASVRPGLAVPVDGSPAVGDIDRDGKNEVVVGAGSTWRTERGGVIVLRRDGSVKCRYEALNYTNNDNGVFSSPALGDVDGDSYPDIVFGAWDLHVHAIDRNCNPISGFPINVEDSTWGSPALYDVDGDGRMEIFIGSDQFAGGFIDWSGGEFRALDWQNGVVRELWKRRSNDTFFSSASIGDIDGDGKMEVVTGGGHYYNRNEGRQIWAFNIEDGTNQPGFPVMTLGSTMPTPALGDVNKDGVTDVVASSHDGYVRALRGNGSLIWQSGLRFNNSSPGGAAQSPIIADFDGDADNDVGVGNNWGYFVLDGANGAEKYAVNIWNSFESAGAVGNFGPHGWKLITSSFNTPNNQTRIQAHNIPTPRRTPPWPMIRKDARHYAAPNSGGDPIPPGYCSRPVNPKATPSAKAAPRGYWFLGADGSIYAFGGAPHYGSANGKLNFFESAVALQPSPTGNGYYILTSAGRIFTFGDAQSFGSMEGTPLNAPIIGMAPTKSNHGYWLLGRDGGIFSFGDATFYGSMGGTALNAPIISMARTPTGRGYWMLASDGGVFSFGDATFWGSTGGLKLNAPIISMGTSKSGGYWLVGWDGGVFSFGVPFYGSIPGTGLCTAPAGVQLRPTKTGAGYYVLSSDGGVFSFGDAYFHGSQPGLGFSNRAVDMAVRP
jgi:hypothetical protein